MAMIHQSIQHNSGIPLGGVGTGTVEVRPDGLFHEWEIMNTGQWSPASPGSDQGRSAMAPEDLVFMVRTRTPDGHIVARYLALREQLHDLYCLAWARSVQSIDFEGTFPLGRLTYQDKALPVAVQAELFSPFVPLDSRASGTPGFYVHFTVKNLTDAPVDVSILGMMKNPAGWAQENREPRNKLIMSPSPQLSPHGGEGTNAPSVPGAVGRSILLTADDMIPDHFSTGDATFSAIGGEVSCITGCFAEDRRAMTFWRSRFGLKMMSLLHQFRDDGRVHHFFTPDFSAVDNGFDRVDMSQQFVMLTARDYLWSGDRAYLERLWPHIIRAMDNTALLDTDGDGLPDSDTRRNTYDAWDFTGCPSYIASLWLGALKAAVRLAHEMGDFARAAAWRDTYERGLASFESKLWNGEYYVLWRDGDAVDECCMSDQMSGDWFAAACGWGPILAPERIKQALRAIVTHNFRPGEGLLNASYPEGKQRRLAASGNYQADAPWTGIEYTVAALLIANGMAPEAMAVVRDIHERYLRAGRVWNHVECGGHYYRAMSSWTVLIALSGFAWDQPTGTLTFAPVHFEPVEARAGRAIRYPFFTSGAWGRFKQDVSGQSVRIEVLSGELGLRKLALPEARGFERAVVTVDGSPVRCSITACGDGVCVEFERGVKVGKVVVVAVDSPV